MSEPTSFKLPVMELSQVSGTAKIVNGPSFDAIVRAFANDTEVFFIIESKRKKRYRVNVTIKGIHRTDEAFRDNVDEKWLIHLQNYRILSYSDVTKTGHFQD